MKWYLIMGLICISVVISGIWALFHLPIGHLHISGKISFQLLWLFLIGSFAYFATVLYDVFLSMFGHYKIRVFCGSIPVYDSFFSISIKKMLLKFAEELHWLCRLFWVVWTFSQYYFKSKNTGQLSIYLYFLQSLSSGSYSFQCTRSFSSLIRFIPKYFYCFWLYCKWGCFLNISFRQLFF